jgi:carbonic anhydrase
MTTKLVLLILLSGTPFAGMAEGEEPHWQYEDQLGPEHWGELAEQFSVCSEGKNQSPIDLVGDLPADLPELNFKYMVRGGLIEVNTGHAIQENVRPGNTIEFLEEQFELKQFHFHSPSEHTIKGEHFPMEVHFVHQNEDGKLLVVGLMFEAGEHNEAMNQLPSFRAKRGESPSTEPVNFNEMVAGRGDYFLYNGSLTTPPCSEGVQWIVIKQPIIASPEQLQHFQDLLGFANNRPIQTHNSRIILE